MRCPQGWYHSESSGVLSPHPLVRRPQPRQHHKGHVGSLDSNYHPERTRQPALYGLERILVECQDLYQHPEITRSTQAQSPGTTWGAEKTLPHLSDGGGPGRSGNSHPGPAGTRSSLPLGVNGGKPELHHRPSVRQRPPRPCWRSVTSDQRGPKAEMRLTG